IPRMVRPSALTRTTTCRLFGTTAEEVEIGRNPVPKSTDALFDVDLGIPLQELARQANVANVTRLIARSPLTELGMDRLAFQFPENLTEFSPNGHRVRRTATDVEDFARNLVHLFRG